MKGLVFGNSHVGAVRLGWDQSRSIDLDFYSIPGGGGPNVHLKDGRIFPNRKDAKLLSTIEGVHDGGLDLSGYDYVVFCSLGLGAVREAFPSNILRKLSLAEFMRPESGETMPVSRAFLDKAVREAFSKLMAVAALRAARTVFDGPILCAPTPIPVVPELEKNHPLRRVYGPDIADFTAWFAATQLEIIGEFADTLGLKVLDYPDLAWVAAGSTPGEYICTTNDPWHMNAAYGRLVLDQVRSALDAITEVA